MDALPYLIFGLVAGHVSDATPRRRVMVGASLVSAGALVCVPLASLAWKNPTPLLVVAAAFVVQSAFVFFDAANFGVLPSIVGRGKVTVANARLYGWTSVCEGVSPVVGGLLLVVVTPYALLWLDAASFVLCALLILRIPAGRSESRRMLVDERAPMWESIRSGIAFLWSHRLLRDTTIANLAISATNGALYSQLVIWADGHLGIRSGDPRLGLVFMALPLGAILGSFSSAWFNRLGSPRTVVGGAALVTGLAGLGAVWSSELWLALALLVVSQAGALVAMLVGVSLRQRLAPNNLVSRVSTTGRMVALGVGFPLGAAVAAIITVVTGNPGVGVSAVFVVALLAWPLLWLGGPLDRNPLDAGNSS